MSGITTTGLGSGVNVSSIVEGLLAAEGDTKNALLDAKEADVLASISAYGEIRASLDAFKSHVKTMNSEEEVLKHVTSVEENSSGVAMYDAITTTNSQPGTYEIKVTALAKAHRVSTADLGTSTSVLGSGSITFTVNSESFDVLIPSTSNTVEEVRDLINAQTLNSGVFASIITVDTGTKLSLASKETGTDYSMTITVSDDDGNDSDASGLSQLVNANLTLDQAAVDADVELNGSTVTSQSNVISSMIEGVIVTLKNEDAANGYTLTVTNDTEGFKGLVTDYVEKYNDVLDVVGKHTAFSGNGDEEEFSGVLIGDPIVRSIMYQLRGAQYHQNDNVSESIRVFSDMGVSTDGQSGKLIIDDAVLSDALRDNFTQSGKVLTGDGVGLINRMEGSLNILMQTGGSLSSRLTSLATQKTEVEDNRRELTLSLNSLQTRLLQQYNAMDRIVASLRNTSEFLAIQMDGFVQPFSFRSNG